MPDLVIGFSLLLFYTSIKLDLGILTILLAHISFSIPLTTLVIIARMQRIDRTLEDAAMDLGADEWTTMWKVTLPLLMPGIVAAALLPFPWSFNDFVITFFVSGVGSSTLPLRGLFHDPPRCVTDGQRLGNPDRFGAADYCHCRNLF